MSDFEMMSSIENFREYMLKRHTVRDFSKRSVDFAIIQKAIQIAGSAPSGANHQPWHFVAISNKDIKKTIREAAEIEENKFYDFDKLPLNPGDTFDLNQVLLVNKKDSVLIGKPFLNDVYKVQAIVLRHLTGPKIRVYKMRPKKKTRKTFGSRRKLTRVLINSISKK